MTQNEKNINRPQARRKPLPQAEIREMSMTTEGLEDTFRAADCAAYFVRGAVLANGGKVKVTVTSL
ncbi:MAG: hypothetical protein IJ366_09790 [Clostridia bacterium]|nr:hypothetical protein [Clostridia bacterium]